MDNGMFINFVLSALIKKIVVPSDFHNQAQAVQEMQADDVSGLVDSLTDFSVNTATVDFSIETANDTFTKKLQLWLEHINKVFSGRIPRGIKSLAKEYFIERWKGSSFPILKLGQWENFNGIIVPMKAFFVDGGSVFAQDQDNDESNNELSLLNYDYYLGSNKQEKLDNNVIITKPYGRQFDKYPSIYLIKRGIYHNWKIIQSIKNKETEILEQVIPYLFLIKKGSPDLLKEGITYSNNQLQQVINDFQTLMDEIKSSNTQDMKSKLPVRGTNFDEELKHLIPDLSTIFNRELFTVAERNILTGLGFVDVVEAVSTSRRESILNPKAFIEEVKTGVEDFKQIMKEVVYRIIEANTGDHRKYVKSEFNIIASPVKSFMTDNFKQRLYQLWRAGRLSDQTAIEMIAETDFNTELARKKKEAKKGHDATFYPPLTDNREGVGKDLLNDEPSENDVEEFDENGNPISEEKRNPEDRKEFDNSSIELEGSPYNNIKELPKDVKDNLTTDLQGVFVKVFNKAYIQYESEIRAFRVAWSVIRQIGRKDKKGIWTRKQKRIKGKLSPMKMSTAILEKAVAQEEKEILEQGLEKARNNIQEKLVKTQLELAESLLKKRKEEDNGTTE